MQIITKRSFGKKVLKSRKYIVVLFTGKKCRPCDQMESRVEKAYDVYRKKKYINFYKVYLQGSESLFQKADIMTIPHVMFFYKGRRCAELSGLHSVFRIKDFVKANIIRS